MDYYVTEHIYFRVKLKKKKILHCLNQFRSLRALPQAAARSAVHPLFGDGAVVRKIILARARARVCYAVSYTHLDVYKRQARVPD